jgi:hypothetical protein
MFDDLPCFMRPRLRLFLSVDLVGSTALKQSGYFPLPSPKEEDSLEDIGANWFAAITSFYRDIESKFSAVWHNYKETISKSSKWPVGADPFLWKSNGDELIYVKELADSRECYACIMCWLDVIHSYRQNLRNKKSHLDVKASAWIAGFPISNSEVVFSSGRGLQLPSGFTGMSRVDNYTILEKWYGEKEETSNYIRDFIGPSMDTGFRVSSKATPRKMTVSIEVALLLSMATAPVEYKARLSLRYDGRESLKGVFGGKPYPIFWVDTHLDEDLSLMEDKLQGQDGLDKEKVLEFCRKFIEENEKYVFLPFVIGDKEPLVSELPKNYEEILRHMANQWGLEKQKLQIEERSLRENVFNGSDSIGEEVSSQNLSSFVSFFSGGAKK